MMDRIFSLGVKYSSKYSKTVLEYWLTSYLRTISKAEVNRLYQVELAIRP